MFYDTGNTAKIQKKHANKLHDILQALDFATTPKQMRFPSTDFHTLKGNLCNFYSVKVDANWRITFTFKGKDAILVNYQDYH